MSTRIINRGCRLLKRLLEDSLYSSHYLMLIKMNLYRAVQHMNSGDISCALSILLANMDIFSVGMHALYNLEGKDKDWGKRRYYVCWGDVD